MAFDTVAHVGSTPAKFERRIALVFEVMGTLACLLPGCEIKPKPFEHTVEYQSDHTCASHPDHCPWTALERQARFAALVNCLLSGATTLYIDDTRPPERAPQAVVAPRAPRFGYAHVTRPGDEVSNSPAHGTVCQVASRHDRELTWATCGTESTNVPLRCGSSIAMLIG
jgi:hypothetical protein